MNNYIPYTYLITFLPTGQKYYGVRYAKKCNPTDLWRTYFTSSKTVKELIKNHGKKAFKIEIRKTFPNAPSKARLWETNLLKRINAAQHKEFLNLNNGDKKFFITKHSEETKRKLTGKRHTEKTKAKIKKARANQIITEEHKKNISKAQTGKKHSVKSREKMSISQKNRKELTCPHCNLKSNNPGNMSRYHFDNCKLN